MRKLLAALILLVLSAPAWSVTNFPSTLDDTTSIGVAVLGQPIPITHHNNLTDAVIALETKVGQDGSSIATSLDYLLTNPLSVDPGHTHTSSGVSFSDGSASVPGIRFGTPVTDTNTGIFHPATGVLAISSLGSEMVRINLTGVGILDATGADFPLDVAGTVRIQAANDLCFGGTSSADNDTCLDRSAAHVLALAGNLILNDQAVGDHTFTLNGITSKTGSFVRVFLVSGDAQPAFSITANGRLNFGPGGATATDATLYRTAADQLGTDDSFSILGANLVMSNDGSGVQNIVVGTTNGLKIGTATAQRLGFFNATPVVQNTSTTDLRTGLINLGFFATGGASPLNLNGGVLTTTGNVDFSGSSQVTIGGQFGTVETITLANGANTNVALGATTSIVRINGPSGAFSINGFTGGASGRIVHVTTTVNQTLTITNEATSTAANQIRTHTAADVVCGTTEQAAFSMIYDTTAQKWRVISVMNCPTT